VVYVVYLVLSGLCCCECFQGRVGLGWLQACVLAYYVAYSEDPQSMRFDGTIPQRIQRLQMLSAHRDNRELEVGRDREEDSYNNC